MNNGWLTSRRSILATLLLSLLLHWVAGDIWRPTPSAPASGSALVVRLSPTAGLASGSTPAAESVTQAAALSQAGAERAVLSRRAAATMQDEPRAAVQPPPQPPASGTRRETEPWPPFAELAAVERGASAGQDVASLTDSSQRLAEDAARAWRVALAQHWRQPLPPRPGRVLFELRGQHEGGINLVWRAGVRDEAMHAALQAAAQAVGHPCPQQDCRLELELAWGD